VSFDSEVRIRVAARSYELRNRDTSPLAEPFRASYVVWERRRRSRKALSPGRPRSMGDAGCTRTFSFVVVGMFGLGTNKAKQKCRRSRRLMLFVRRVNPPRHFLPRAASSPQPGLHCGGARVPLARLAQMCRARHGRRDNFHHGRCRSFFRRALHLLARPLSLGLVSGLVRSRLARCALRVRVPPNEGSGS